MVEGLQSFHFKASIKETELYLKVVYLKSLGATEIGGQFNS